MNPTRRFIDSPAELREILRPGEDFCVVDESADYPGELAFFHADQERFVREHSDYLSDYCLLSHLFTLDHFLATLRREEVSVFFLPATRPILDRYDEWSEPLEVGGLALLNGLHPYQQFGLRRAFDASKQGRAKVSGFFFNFGTGTGKTILAAAGAQELVVNRDEIDLVLVFTLATNKLNMARKIEEITQLATVVPEGTKAKRVKLYVDPPPVVVLNYERVRFDYDEVEAMIAGKRVLWVLDEVQKILHGEGPKNKSRKAIDELVKATRKSVVWPMSATIVKASPFRYHDVFSLVTPRKPLGTRKDFERRYCEEVEEWTYRGVQMRKYHWDVPALSEVRHRVSAFTQPVRKTDPGVREYFKGIQAERVRVQLSREERRIYDAIAEESRDYPEDRALYYAALRYVCNTTAAFRYSSSTLIKGLANQFPESVDLPSTKFSMILDRIETIRDQGDQVVVFTQWTYLSLFHFAKLLSNRGIDYVTHYGSGSGMTSAEAQQAQDTFKANPDCTVFLSSDAGAMGLNFQNARYVINIECPYDPDLLTQRNDRIDRADSYLDGLTAYIYTVDDTVEEQIWGVNQLRRRVQEALQGTTEALSRYSAEELALARLSESEAMARMMDGSLIPR